jgi:hypothetical protein
MTPTNKWNDGLLDQMRMLGDPDADMIVKDLVASGKLESANYLMKTLVRYDMPPPDGLPQELITYLDTAGRVSAEDFKTLKSGQRLFNRYGHLILLILVCGSLPTTYAARKGVKVLKGTGRLLINPNRRLWETAQMVVNIMGPGGLSPTGKGVRTAQKVRLMHAAIRHLLLTESNPAWNVEELGVPVNQEDLAGTLLVFSYFVLEGLKEFGVWIDPKERWGYFRTWQIVGRIMGVVPELIPADLDEAAELNSLICQRQFGTSQEGRDMLLALLFLLRENTPQPIIWAPAATMRYLVPPDAANMIGIPRDPFGCFTVRLLATLNKLASRALGRHARHPLFFRRFGLEVTEWLIRIDRGDDRAHFYIPTHLQTYWGSPSLRGGRTFWQRWFDRLL